MAASTGIGWTRSTFNPWIGCTRVGPGCDHCYAEAEDARRKWGGRTHWGAGVARHRTRDAYWFGPERWDALAREEVRTGVVKQVPDKPGRRGQVTWSRPGFWPVFCASLADVFDNEVEDRWRFDLWSLIERTPFLDWQLVTKRVGNVARMVPAPWMASHFPPHVWIVPTMVNQEEFDRDADKLFALPAAVRGLSIEPMLGGIWFPGDVQGRLHWAIYGGESSQTSGDGRALDIEWIRAGIAQCRRLGIAPFVKQLGSQARAYAGMGAWNPASGSGKRADPAEWPEDLRVQEFPR